MNRYYFLVSDDGERFDHSGRLRHVTDIVETGGEMPTCIRARSVRDAIRQLYPYTIRGRITSSMYRYLRRDGIAPAQTKRLVGNWHALFSNAERFEYN